jgi:hypothetical protein
METKIKIEDKELKKYLKNAHSELNAISSEIDRLIKNRYKKGRKLWKKINT